MATKIPSKATERIEGSSKNKIVVSKENPPEPQMSFAFRFWKQIELFGLDKATREWFVTTLEKLKELSDKTFDQFTTDSGLKNNFRIHAINWNQSSLTKEKFHELLPIQYRNDEYEIYQFQVTTSKGRVIGFFDERNVFQIVLLDIAHNMQLSNYNDYQKVVTGELPNCYNKVVGKLLKIQERIKKAKGDELKNLVQELDTIIKEEYSHGHFIFINEIHHEKLNQILELKEYGELDLILIDALDLLHKEKTKI